jgi:predicted kinase
LLIVMAGLPASGKTTIARLAARELGAMHLRIDTVEQAIVDAGVRDHPVGPVGYMIGYVVAEEQLRLGLTVIAEVVNPIRITRDAWRDVAVRAGVPHLDVEVVCSDPVEHERRARTRVVDIANLRPPTWDEIVNREYEPWDRDRLVLDTAAVSAQACAARLLSTVAATA